MVLESIVTAAILANALPVRVAPVLSVTAWLAMMVPSNTEVVPSVAEVPTCQKMLAALAPPLRIIWRPAVVTRVDAI